MNQSFKLTSFQKKCFDGSFGVWVVVCLWFFPKQEASPSIFLSGVPTVSNCADQYKKRTQRVLKRLFEQHLVVSRLLVSWERSNGVGEGKKEFVFHSCVHATSSKTPKLLQLAWYQLCFLLADDPFSEFCRLVLAEPREALKIPC